MSMTLTKNEFNRIRALKQEQVRRVVNIPTNSRLLHSEALSFTFQDMDHSFVKQPPYTLYPGSLAWVKEPFFVRNPFKHKDSNRADVMEMDREFLFDSNKRFYGTNPHNTDSKNYRMLLMIEGIKLQKIHMAEDRDIVIEGFTDIADFIREWNEDKRNKRYQWLINPWTFVYKIKLISFTE